MQPKTPALAVVGASPPNIGKSSSEAMTAMMDEIVGIIERVSSFARQTNLLALNAAIEAARAQSAGMGFALVANEIRKLAVEAGSATGEISALLVRSRKQIDGLGGSKVA